MSLTVDELTGRCSYRFSYINIDVEFLPDQFVVQLSTSVYNILPAADYEDPTGFNALLVKCNDNLHNNKIAACDVAVRWEFESQQVILYQTIPISTLLPDQALVFQQYTDAFIHHYWLARNAVLDVHSEFQASQYRIRRIITQDYKENFDELTSSELSDMPEIQEQPRPQRRKNRRRDVDIKKQRRRGRSDQDKQKRQHRGRVAQDNEKQGRRKQNDPKQNRRSKPGREPQNQRRPGKQSRNTRSSN